MKVKQVHVNYDPDAGKTEITPVEPVTTDTPPNTDDVDTPPPTGDVDTPPVTDDVDTPPPTGDVDTPPVTDDVDTPPTSVEIQEQQVLEYLSTKLGKTVESLNELSKDTPEIPVEVEKYLEFKKETNRGFEDFLKANRDISSLSDEDILVEYVLRENEGFDSTDALEHLDDMFGYEEDASEKDKRKKDRLEKSFLAKARKSLKEESDKYKVPVASTDNNTEISDDYKDALAFKQQYEQEQVTVTAQNKQIRDKFVAETDKLFSEDFKGFDISLGDNVNEAYKPTDVENIKKANVDLKTSLGKFFNEDGSIKDVQGYHKALTAAYDPDAFAKYFYEKGKNAAIEGKVDDKPADVQRTNTGKPTTNPNSFAKAVDVDPNRGVKAVVPPKFKMKHYH